MALRHLAKWGAEALKPQFVGGNWHKPLISARTAAELKKRFRAEGRCVTLEKSCVSVVM